MLVTVEYFGHVDGFREADKPAIVPGLQFLDTLASVLAGRFPLVGLTGEATPPCTDVGLGVPVGCLALAAIEVNTHDRLPN